MEKTVKKKVAKKKIKMVHRKGVVHILSTYNNTIITITDPMGNALTTTSSGQSGFKGPKKATPYAASIIVGKAVEKAHEYGLEEVDVLVKGVGGGRDSAIRALNANGLRVLSIKDVTPIAHNGCRPRKPRRV